MLITDIKPYPKNAKKHPKKQIEQVANSIKEFGMNQPIVVDKQGVIIVGHGRYEALKSLGMEIKDEYIKVVDLTEEQAKAYRLADNKLNESEWDMDLVIEELKGLSQPMLDLTGFDKDLIIEPDEKDDEVPDVPEEPQSKLGDLYELGNHRVLCGDSTKIEDVERLMDGKKADMVFTDPPYGMFLNADWSGAKSKLSFQKEKGLLGGKKYDNVIGDGDDFKDEFITTTLAVFDYCKEIFLWGGDYYAHLIPERNKGSWIVWDKRLDESADKMYGSCYELCWSKNRHKREIARVKWAGVFGTEQEPEKKRSHPTQKPCLLSEWFFSRYAKEKGLIADLFLGSGSTLIASEKTGRICYGMELDPKYVDVIVQRYCDYTGNNKIIKNGKEITWQRK